MLEFERADAIVKVILEYLYPKDYLKYSVNTRDKKINKSTNVLNFVFRRVEIFDSTVFNYTYFTKSPQFLREKIHQFKPLPICKAKP